MKISTRNIALMATMAALYVVLSQLPGFPVIGVEKAQIGVVSAVVPLFGFILGPWLGASTAFFGGVASRILFGASLFTWLTLPAMPLSAFAAGSLSKQRIGRLDGWIVAALVLGGLISAWYMTWVGQVVWLYPLLHWAALGVVLIFRDWLAYFVQYGEESELMISVALCGFVAAMMAHMYGSLAYFVAVGFTLDPVIFWGVIPVVAIERLVITVITAVLGVPILLALRQSVH